MLEKKEDIMIHVDQMKRAKVDAYAAEAIKSGLPDPKLKKPETADKLL
jgi:hypothetical protein